MQTQEIQISIPKMDIKTILVKVVGDSELIMHQWSTKAKKMIEDKHSKKPKTAKEVRNPEQEYKDSMYTTPNGKPCLPAVAFKNAAVDACSHVDGVTKVEARGAFHIVGDMVEVKGEPRMRQDFVKVGMGVADLRYRAGFKKWSAEFQIRYNSNVLSAEQIVNLLSVGGFAVGVGDWRPQKDGSYGMFHVE